MSFELSEKIKLILVDGDIVWPTTMNGHYRLVVSSVDHNIYGKGEISVNENEMINGVLNENRPSRWRSKTNSKRHTPNHFSITSPSVSEVYVAVGDVWVKFK